jgi:hypothetical protein
LQQAIPLIMNLYAFQYLGEKCWFQVDGMSRINRVIGNCLKKHGFARVFNKELASWGGRATDRAD